MKLEATILLLLETRLPVATLKTLSLYSVVLYSTGFYSIGCCNLSSLD